MTAYNSETLLNIAVIKKAKQWYAHKLITDEQMAAIIKNNKIDFYTPALFLKIGLFIFTCFIICSTIGLYSTFIYNIFSHHIKSFLIINFTIYSFVCFIFLELYIIKTRKAFHAGMDEALLYSGIAFLCVAISTLINYDFFNSNTFLVTEILIFPFLFAAIIRYTDRFITFISTLCLYSISYSLILLLGEFSKLIMPFAFMALSACLYFFMNKYKKNETFFIWRKCLTVVECIALLVGYLACNYYIIRESSITFFGLKLLPSDDIPLAILFYLTTALVPILYVFYGLKNKDRILFIIGIILIFAAAVTFKYYFSLGHPELTLTTAGIILIVLIYVVIKSLKTPKYSITYNEDIDEDNFFKSNAEALLIAQSFTQHTQIHEQQNTNDFGGGSFGGGGASDSF